MRPTSPKHANVNSATIILPLPTPADVYTAAPPFQTDKNRADQSVAGNSISKCFSLRPRHCPPPHAAGPRLSQP